MFVFDFRNIIVLISLAIHASLLWILYRYGRKTPGGVAYSVAVLAIAGWIFPMALFRAALFGEVMVWARLLYVMASFTSTTFLFFTFVFPDNKKMPFWAQALLVLENIFIVFLVLHPTLVIRGIQPVLGRENIILWGPLYFVYSSHISLLFLAGFIILFRKWRRAQGLTRQQIGYILGGYFFAANLAMTTNLILPWFGYFELNWLGQFFSTLVAAFTTYAILKHQLMNIKLLATEGFLLILNLFLLFEVITASSIRALIINLVVWLVILFISFLLMRSVKREVSRREEIQRLAEQLNTANAKLQELDKLKSEFLSIAAHQLRTPLTIIKGYVSMIQEGDYGKIDNPKIDTVLGNVYKSNEHLICLVNDFLDVSRIEGGRTSYTFAKTDLKKVAEELVTEIFLPVKEKGLQFKVEIAKNLPAVTVDMEKIRNVMWNFLTNAVKYTPKGWLKMELFKKGKKIIYQVSDNGIGLTKLDLENVYQKFYRAEEAKRITATGVGLGLFVCKKFIEAHKGEVFVASPGPGQGATFGFRLPMKK